MTPLYTILFYGLNAPLMAANSLHVIYMLWQEVQRASVVKVLGVCLTVTGLSYLASRAERMVGKRPRPKGRDEVLSTLKGVCILGVAVVHCAPPSTLQAFPWYRATFEFCVPVLLVCSGITGSNARASYEWYSGRAAGIVPVTACVLSVLWVWKLMCNFHIGFRFLGGTEIVSTVFLTYFGQPGCIGALWFVSVYAQLVTVLPLLVRCPFALVVPAWFVAVVSERNPLEILNPWIPAIPSPCHGNMFLYLVVFAPRYVFHVVAGLCMRDLPRYHAPRVATGAIVLSCGVHLLCQEHAFAWVAHSWKLFHPVILTWCTHMLLDEGVAWLGWIGDRSYHFYMGHVLALNLLLEDFTLDSYRIPWCNGLRPFLFIALSCSAGVAIHAAAVRSRSAFAERVGVLLVMCVAFTVTSVLAVNTNALNASPPMPAVQSALPKVATEILPPKAAEGGAAPRAPPLTTSHPYAFFTLIKGGSHTQDYNSYSSRCQLLQGYRDDRTDDIAFHEGNVPPMIQVNLVERLKVKFVDLRDHGGFVIPRNTTTFPVRTRGAYAIGYRHMCRFFALQWMHIMRNYEIVMRIDEDVMVHRMERNPFQHMKAHSDVVYAYALETKEGHDETVQTMQIWMDRYTNRMGRGRIDVRYMYFTNVFLSRVDWWLRDDVQRFLRDVDDSQNIYRHRWGDAPIQSTALKLLLAKTALFQVDYSHGSTSNEIRGGREVRYTAHAKSKVANVMELYDAILPCIVVDAFHLGSASSADAAASILKSHLMLETGLPKGVIDDLSNRDASFAYQIDVLKRDAPLPQDNLQGLDRLDKIAQSIGEPTWKSDAAMLQSVSEHRCAPRGKVFKRTAPPKNTKKTSIGSLWTTGAASRAK